MAEITNAAFVEGLRALADWYEQNPTAELPHSQEIAVMADDTKENARKWAQCLGTFTKDIDDTFVRLRRSFGLVTLRVVFLRDAVCQKRVVGTKTIKEMVPDPAAPKVTMEVQDPNAPLVEVERTEEVTEWDCPPLLANDEDVAA